MDKLLPMSTKELSRVEIQHQWADLSILRITSALLATKTEAPSSANSLVF